MALMSTTPSVHQSYSLSVYSTTDLSTGQRLLCWRYQPAGQGLSLKLLRESWRLALEIDHPCVTQAVKIEDLSDVLTVYTTVPKQTLGEFVALSPTCPWGPEDAIRHVYNLVAVLAAAQQLGIAHRQLTASKVYADQEGFQVCDLPPQAHSLDQERQLAAELHPNYLSPERAQLLQGQTPADYCPYRADVFSLGVAILEVVFHCTVEALPLEQLPSMLEHLEDFSEFHSLLQAMLAPQSRPSFLDLVPDIPVCLRCTTCKAKAPVSGLKPDGKVYCGEKCVPRSEEGPKKMTIVSSRKIDRCQCGQSFKLRSEVVKKLCITCQQRSTNEAPTLPAHEKLLKPAEVGSGVKVEPLKQALPTEAKQEPPKPVVPSKPGPLVNPASQSPPFSPLQGPPKPVQSPPAKVWVVCGKSVPADKPGMQVPTDSRNEFFCSEACLKSEKKTAKKHPMDVSMYSLPVKEGKEPGEGTDLPQKPESQKAPPMKGPPKIGGGIVMPKVKPLPPKSEPQTGELPGSIPPIGQFGGAPDRRGQLGSFPSGGLGRGELPGRGRETGVVRGAEGPFVDEAGRVPGVGGMGSGTRGIPGIGGLPAGGMGGVGGFGQFGGGGMGRGGLVPGQFTGGPAGDPALRGAHTEQCRVCLKNFARQGRMAPLPGHEAMLEFCSEECQLKYMEDQDQFEESGPFCLRCQKSTGHQAVKLPCKPEEHQFCGTDCTRSFIKETLGETPDLEFLVCPACDTPVPREVSAAWQAPAAPMRLVPKLGRPLPRISEAPELAPMHCCKCKTRAELKVMKCGHGLCRLCFDRSKEPDGFVNCLECGLKTSLKSE